MLEWSVLFYFFQIRPPAALGLNPMGDNQGYTEPVYSGYSSVQPIYTSLPPQYSSPVSSESPYSLSGYMQPVYIGPYTAAYSHSIPSQPPSSVYTGYMQPVYTGPFASPYTSSVQSKPPSSIYNGCMQPGLLSFTRLIHMALQVGNG